MPETPVCYEDVALAARRLQGVAHLTPVMSSRTLDERSGNRVLLKCENFQRAGAFKFRGAYNALASQLEAAQTRGVVTHSSGNHAQALALAGRLLQVPVTVVMPQDAPAVKAAATRGYGAEIVLYDPAREQREVISGRLKEERGLLLIPPFDDPHVIAGQGTAAMELVDQANGLDVVLAPCGGGGLLSGTALAVRRLNPHARILGVEPEGANNGQRAFRSGRLEVVEHPQTMADGLKPRSLGTHTLAVIRACVDDMLTVSEEQIRSSLAFLWERMKLVVEPSGAVALAPVLHGLLGCKGKRVGVILSGGNADIGAVADWLRAPSA
ncbi:MAG: threo-3-hydroxy-L-aspartate ammonia-lyase [Candidatus Lambdaproteobacteria bacterium]|nr:threo-3-hydroxy-L-aspartate ammonia-lyase [Candidatus Lambdaproteobacteria bacterium]